MKDGQPVKNFNDWHKAGSWADSNIKSEFTSYSFESYDTRSLMDILYKIIIIFSQR
jgi:hypothetical protein